MFKQISLCTFCFTMLFSSLGTSTECKAQYDLKAQDFTLQKQGSWQTLNTYIRNVGNPFYLGDGAQVIAWVYYPAKNDIQAVYAQELSEWIWPHPAPWNWGHDFYDYNIAVSFKPKHYNTTARVIFWVAGEYNSPFYDTNYYNNATWRDYYFTQ